MALSDSYGNSCQSYEYSAFGQVAASDPNFIANPYLFTGRRFDYETGLYYYRARYYNPYIGRFLQTDPIGYGDGINWYAYCGNNSINRADPSGLMSFYIPIESMIPAGKTIDQYDLKALVASWLKNAGFYSVDKKYGNLWSIGSVEVKSAQLSIDLDYIGNEEDYIEPDFVVEWITLKHEEGHPMEGQIAANVPIVFFDTVGLLTERALNRIINSAIEEVNGWYNGLLNRVSPALMIYRLLNRWDCEYFKNSGETFRYQNNTFSSSNINYIVGGHAFRHYGWNIDSALNAVAAWKANPVYGHSPGSPEMAGVYYWFLKGYDEYNNRVHW